MAVHVRDASCRLVGRQGEGELGVHERELRTLGVVRVAALHAQLVVGDDGVLGRLAASRRNGEHDGDGQHIGDLFFRFEELPHVAVIARADGNGLRGVDDRAAAHGEHPVDALLLADFDAFAGQGDFRVGAHAAQFDPVDARVLQCAFYAVKQPAFLGALPAVVQQDFLCTAFGQFRADLQFGVAPEHEMGGGYEFEVLHRRDPFSLRPTSACSRHRRGALSFAEPLSQQWMRNARGR